MILTVVSPVIGWLLVRCGWKLIGAMMIVALFFDYGVPFFKMGDLVFFLIGARVSLEPCQWIDICVGKEVRNSWLMIATWAVLVVLKVWLTHKGWCEYDGVIPCQAGFKINLLLVCNLFGIVAMWLLSELLVTKIPTRFDCVLRISFFLYCLHWLILNGFNILMKHIGVEGVLSYVLRPMLTIITCAACFCGLKKASPHLVRILSGGRA